MRIRIEFVAIAAFLVVSSGLMEALSRSKLPSTYSSYTSKLNMGNKDADEGYGPIGSLIRQGPVPFFIRITNPSTYEAAVDKYMALEKCDRKTAQGNMDAYFQDPNGWAANKLRLRKTGQDLDYGNMNTSPKDLILTAVWTLGISFLFFRIFAIQVLHEGQ